MFVEPDDGGTRKSGKGGFTVGNARGQGESRRVNAPDARDRSLYGRLPGKRFPVYLLGGAAARILRMATTPRFSPREKERKGEDLEAKRSTQLPCFRAIDRFPRPAGGIEDTLSRAYPLRQKGAHNFKLISPRFFCILRSPDPFAALYNPFTLVYETWYMKLLSAEK